MHDETTRGSALELDRVQSTLLELLLTDEAPGLWSVDETAHAMGDPIIAVDAVEALHAAGLVHWVGDFVFPTRAAARYRRLEQAG